MCVFIYTHCSLLICLLWRQGVMLASHWLVTDSSGHMPLLLCKIYSTSAVSIQNISFLLGFNLSLCSLENLKSIKDWKHLLFTHLPASYIFSASPPRKSDESWHNCFLRENSDFDWTWSKHLISLFLTWKSTQKNYILSSSVWFWIVFSRAGFFSIFGVF